MAILRPNQLPAATTPLGPTDLVVVDQGAGGVNAADPQDVVDAVAPVVSQSDAEAGLNNVERMTSLRTKQSIASEVGVSLASKAQGDLADSAVQPTRQVIAGAGLTGGGSLSADRTFNVGAGTGITVNADDVSLSATTISRLLIGGGTTSQVLQKVSNTDYDVEWATVAAATAVSYAPQTLTSGEQLQARTNINAADAATAVTLTGSQTLTNKTLTSPVINVPQGEFLRGYINGLSISNNVTDPSNDIDVAAGSAGSDGATPILMTLSSTITKRLDAAWAVGNGNGGLDTGSPANVTYHVWLIQRSDTGVTDILLSASATSPVMPTSYDRKAYLWPFVRDAGANIAFKQVGNDFVYSNSLLVLSSGALPTTATLLSVKVPAGVRVRANLGVSLSITSSPEVVLVSSPEASDEALTTGNFTVGVTSLSNGNSVNDIQIVADSIGRIRYKGSSGAAIGSFTIRTRGFTLLSRG